MFICRTKVERRYGSLRKDVRGFFPGAIVKRGKDWEWGPQDGKAIPKKIFTIHLPINFRQCCDTLLLVHANLIVCFCSWCLLLLFLICIGSGGGP